MNTDACDKRKIALSLILTKGVNINPNLCFLSHYHNDTASSQTVNKNLSPEHSSAACFLIPAAEIRMYRYFHTTHEVATKTRGYSTVIHNPHLS